MFPAAFEAHEYAVGDGGPLWVLGVAINADLVVGTAVLLTLALTHACTPYSQAGIASRARASALQLTPCCGAQMHGGDAGDTGGGNDLLHGVSMWCDYGVCVDA